MSKNIQNGWALEETVNTKSVHCYNATVTVQEEQEIRVSGEKEKENIGCRLSRDLPTLWIMVSLT